MSWERWDVSRVFQKLHAASLSKSSRHPGKGSLAAIFFKHVYIDKQKSGKRWIGEGRK
jgi:hypothetical protein